MVSLEVLYLLILMSLPSLLVVRFLNLNSDLWWPLSLLALFALVLAAMDLWRHRRLSLVARLLILLSAGCNLVGAAILFEYKRLMYMDLSSQLIIETGMDAVRSINSFSWKYHLLWGSLAISLLLGMGYLTLRLFNAGVKKIRASIIRPWVKIASLALLVFSSGLYGKFTLWSWDNFQTTRYVTSHYTLMSSPRAPSRPSDSVVFLHLESVNSGTFLERRNGQLIWKHDMPGLREIWQKAGGVLFPFFWANTAATNRAIESILCGVSGNFGNPLLLRDDVRQKPNCIPKTLRESGYTTYFWDSYFNLDFYNIEKYMRAVGLDEIIFGDAIMKPEDKKWAWGFDDCVFYDRLAEFIDANAKVRTSPFFAYTEVSMHHSPFTESRYPGAAIFSEPKGRVETYLNSLRDQDHCLPRFYRALERLKRDDVHVFIFGDHTVRMQPELDVEDRFAVPLLYLPPAKSKKSEARAIVSDNPPSQADLYPTVMELLFGEPHPRSFAKSLTGKEYDPSVYCSTLVDLYGNISFARDGRRATFSVDERTVSEESFSSEGEKLLKRRPMRFSKFIEKETCPSF